MFPTSIDRKQIPFLIDSGSNVHLSPWKKDTIDLEDINRRCTFGINVNSKHGLGKCTSLSPVSENATPATSRGEGHSMAEPRAVCGLEFTIELR